MCRSSSKVAFFGCYWKHIQDSQKYHIELSVLNVMFSCFMFNNHSGKGFAMHPLSHISIKEISLALEFIIKILTPCKVKTRPIRAENKLPLSQETKNTEL